MEEKDAKTIIKVLLTGPESSGKSSLALKLSEYYEDVRVPEYAREYLDKKRGVYHFDDLFVIAMGQLALERAGQIESRRLLICDTSLFVIKIWSEDKFGRTDTRILELLEGLNYELVLLCKPDIPWIHDPLREDPERRQELFLKYEKELQSAGIPFAIIEGSFEQRFEKSVSLIDKLLNLQCDCQSH